MAIQYNIPAITDRPLRLAVLISGGGTTLANFLGKKQAGLLDVEIPVVIASKSNCAGVERSRTWGLNCVVVSRKDFVSTQAMSTHIFDLCRAANVDLVTLAGYLNLIDVPDDFRYRVINIHPSLIPAFSGPGYYGHHVHEGVVKRGCKISGCTVHFADNEYDHGPIILQQSVTLTGEESAEDVARKVFTAECEAYPLAIQLYKGGKLKVMDQRVIIS
jgi:formyltetrahydrofolate-dependent phosphoribosylglycinamide formyltransferase